MSYTPTTWQTGDTITAAGLNKIEQGIANAGGSSYDIVVTAGDNHWDSSTIFTLTSGTTSAVWNKLTNGDYVRALVILDCSSYTYPMVYTYDSLYIMQLSTEGSISICIRDLDNDAWRTITVESDGTIFWY